LDAGAAAAAVEEQEQWKEKEEKKREKKKQNTHHGQRDAEQHEARRVFRQRVGHVGEAGECLGRRRGRLDFERLLVDLVFFFWRASPEGEEACG